MYCLVNKGQTSVKSNNKKKQKKTLNLVFLIFSVCLEIKAIKEIKKKLYFVYFTIVSNSRGQGLSGQPCIIKCGDQGFEFCSVPFVSFCLRQRNSTIK
jgi:hypothetical protein